MIKSSNLRRLKQLALFQAIENIIAFMQKFDLNELKLQKVFDELVTAFEAFDKAVVQARKTGLTDAINQLDISRDNIFRTLVAFLKGIAGMPMQDRADAANALLAIINKYPNIPTLPLREEGAAITNLLQDFKEPAASTQINMTGAGQFVAMLETTNNEFKDLYNQRTEIEAQIELEVGKKTRIAIEEAFRNVANAINGLAAALGEEPYRTLADQINREVERAQR